MQTQSPLLTLKQASRILGVHENTLRNWERRGILRMTRLPHSRYRRVPREEVQRLAQELNLIENDGASGVWLQTPSNDPKRVAEGKELADVIRAELAQKDNQEETLESVMQKLRGRL